MSLSSKLKMKSDKKPDNLRTDDNEDLLEKMKALLSLQPPELKRQTREQEPESEPEPEPEPEPELAPDISFQNVMFISDKKLDDHIRTQLGFKEVRSYDSNFTNRKPEALLEAGIKHIWVNISEKKAKQWLELNLKNETYTTILIHDASKNNKFLADLKPHCAHMCKLKDVQRLSALSFDELMSQMESLVKIHSPASCLGELFGCSGNITRASKNA